MGLLVESGLFVLFPYHSIVWVHQLHPHCAWFIFACASGSKALSSSTKYNRVQSFWGTKTCNYDFYFNMIMVAHVLSGWMTQGTAKPLERELESCLAQRSTVSAACYMLGPGLGPNYPVCFAGIFLREVTASLPGFPSRVSCRLALLWVGYPCCKQLSPWVAVADEADLLWSRATA